MTPALIVVLGLWLATVAALYWRLRVIVGRSLARQQQLLDLCVRQQQWIRRGEVACHNCPELGTCVQLHGCQRERDADPHYVPPPMTGALMLPSRVRFIQE